MAWLTLLLAGLLEIVFATSVELSRGFTRLWPTVATIVFGTSAVVALSKSLEAIPLSTAYVVFTGMGAVGTVLVGIIAFAEPATAARLACIALVVAGVVGLRVLGGAG